MKVSNTVLGRVPAKFKMARDQDAIYVRLAKCRGDGEAAD